MPYYKEVPGLDEDGKVKVFKIRLPQNQINKIKAFDVLVQNNVDIKLLKECKNAPSYNNQAVGSHLTVKDFKFLKGAINAGVFN